MRNLPVLEGWRYEVFGKDALDLVEGKLAFAVEKGRLKMTHIDDVDERRCTGPRGDLTESASE